MDLFNICIVRNYVGRIPSLETSSCSDGPGCPRLLWNKKTELSGLSQRANYTDRATVACQIS
jgi:hypothetical protein